MSRRWPRPATPGRRGASRLPLLLVGVVLVTGTVLSQARRAGLFELPDPVLVSEIIAGNVRRHLEAERARSLVWKADSEPGHRLGVLPWEVVFRDDFERTTLGPRWRVGSGSWTVQDGRLRATSREQPGTILCLGADFSGDVRVAYTCRALAPAPPGEPCDLSFMISLPDAAPVDPRSGYLFRFGSFLNTVTGLTTGRAELVVDRRTKIVLGREHRVVLQRAGDRYALAIDGDPVFSGTLRGGGSEPRNHRGGFYVWRTVAEFDDLTVSRPARPGSRRR